ncbi:MAG: DUF1800 domain-containing protein [Gemmataceae bacterium]
MFAPAQEPWLPWEPKGEEWNLKWAGHLYRRAGFGANGDELREAVNNGLPSTLDRVFCAPELSVQFKPATAEAELTPAALRKRWLGRMLRGQYPLHEKMSLFWHGHFATSIAKVGDGAAMERQNHLIRRHALKKYGPFLQEKSKDPAMLVYLDSNNNVKGKPNENYAREVMELFSLGVGNYTEKDIREAARAFTGWHTDGTHFTFKPDLHDEGEKAVLGQAGNLNGEDVVRICLEQPVCARFLVRKLYRFFINEAKEPGDAFLEPLVDAFRKSEYDIAALMRTMLSSRYFFSDECYRQRIKSPVELCLGAARAIGMGLVYPEALAGHLEGMGQHIYAPPNVKGWEAGRSWLSTATLVARHEFSRTMAHGEVNVPALNYSLGTVVLIDPGALARRARITEPDKIADYFTELLLDGQVTDALRERFTGFLKEPGDRDARVREMIHTIMTMPEYQLA